MKSVIMSTIAAGFAAAGVAGAGEYLAGDFHQHTLYTDGSNPFHTVMAADNAYGLDWWANSEHGGSRNRDGEGVKWLDTGKYPVNPILGDNPERGNMYRWQSLRDYVFPDILQARMDYPSRIIISGLEWNVPGHEHCSTAIHGYDGTADLISEFEFRFDKSDSDTSRTNESSLVDGGLLEKTNRTRDDAIAACAFMQAIHDQGLGDAWVVPAHIERANVFWIEDFRNWNNAGPDVAFGFEGAPGHQTSGDRGFGRGAAGGGTYGGSGYFCAKVGGLWDALLCEGRGWWNFASSDFHNHWSVGSSDFWPGEYQKNYTFIDTDNADRVQAVFDGLRSGNSFHVEGDLIDALEFTAHGQGKARAVMGETLEVRKGRMVQIKIKVRDPQGANNCPLNMLNPSLEQIGVEVPLNMPVLDHIDLISGEVTGCISPDDPAYTVDTNDTAAVAATFECKACDEEGNMTFVYTFKADKDRYFRLRGSNLPAGVPLETDAMGNPLADYEASDNLYSLLDNNELETKLFEGIEIPSNSGLDNVAEAYADLWFYSNPIFIKVVD